MNCVIFANLLYCILLLMSHFVNKASSLSNTFLNLKIKILNIILKKSV